MFISVRLAAARAAHDRDELAALDAQRDAVERVHDDVLGHAGRRARTSRTSMTGRRGAARRRRRGARAARVTAPARRRRRREAAAAEAARRRGPPPPPPRRARRRGAAAGAAAPRARWPRRRRGVRAGRGARRAHDDLVAGGQAAEDLRRGVADDAGLHALGRALAVAHDGHASSPVSAWLGTTSAGGLGDDDVGRRAHPGLELRAGLVSFSVTG